MSDFYCVGEKDFITSESIDEAVQEWWDAGLGDKGVIGIFVQGYNKKAISSRNKIFEWNIEHLIESLDENYGCEETWGDYSLSPEAKELYYKFVEQVVKEYPVNQLIEDGEPVLVNPKDYVDMEE